MRRGSFFTGLGLLLLAAALVFAVYNLWDQDRAGDEADNMLEQLLRQMPENRAALDQTAVNSGGSIYGGGKSAVRVDGEEIPDYIVNPEMSLTRVSAGGYDCIGVLGIPALGLELPVIDGWSYTALRVAPCLYTGSPYTNDLVVMAHNYDSHFGRIKNLHSGDLLTFTDMDGNVFYYVVDYMDVLSPYAVEEMTSGDWDMTLFTCTIGGQTRVTIRCSRVNLVE